MRERMCSGLVEQAGRQAACWRRGADESTGPVSPDRLADPVRGVGHATCMVRRFRQETFVPAIEDLLSNDERLLRAVPAYWDMGMSVRWQFDVKGPRLNVATRTDDLELLQRSLPHVFQLIDTVSTPGREPSPFDGAVRTRLVDEVSEIGAERHAQEAWIVERLEAERSNRPVGPT